jgi:class 3 adenylate cyclase
MKRPEALSLGGEKHTVSIMMADLRGFTSTAEGLQPEEVIAILNRYFARIIAIIDQHAGIIVDFYGDSVLAFFNGIDDDIKKRAADAVSCALAMQKELAALSEENVRDGLPELAMGVGVNTGEVVVGNIGSETRAKYGIVGSPVNETDRIQSAADAGTVLVSEATYELLSDVLFVSDSCEKTLKGLHGRRCLYQVASIYPKGALTKGVGSTDQDNSSG